MATTPDLPSAGPPKLYLTGDHLTAEQLMSCVQGVEVDLSHAAWAAVAEGRRRLEALIAKGGVVYGVNTGFGTNANVVIDRDKLSELQLNLIRSHAAGVGDPLSVDRVRRLLLLRINVLAKGYSGIRVMNVQRLLKFLNAGVLSYVPAQGSVGASGDLAPLSHLALGMLGEGELYNPRTRNYEPAADVIAEYGLERLELSEKEGLALINGTQFITSLTAEALVRATALMHTADIVSAVTMEALRCQPAPFQARVHDARGHPGQIRVAARLRDILHSEAHPSEIFMRSPHSVQDAYSIRCVPQVHGVVHETVDYVATLINRELNAATDNPMVFEDGIVSAGNFHGEYPAKAADILAMAISELATISERRIERLINSHLSGPNPAGQDPTYYKLPPFLIPNPGLNSGFMIPHCTAAALVVENRTLVHPTSCDSISTSAAQEDHVSMGAYAARKVLQVVENVERVIAIELLAACQGIEFLRPLRSTDAIERVVALVRAKVPFWQRDTYAAPDMKECFKLVRAGAVVRAVDPSLSHATIAGGMTESQSADARSYVATAAHQLRELVRGIPTTLPPPVTGRDPSVPHAAKRGFKSTEEERSLAIRNALRYFPAEQHDELRADFERELAEYGHIYMYRLRPTTYAMRAYPLAVYPARCQQAAAIMLMIQNNLDPAVAQYPQELVTYGGNGSVFQNWAQYHLVMQYLADMTEEQTLVMYSGHPLGLFPSHKDAPRVVVTNGMVVPHYSGHDDYERMYLMGVSQYGQMTAGSYCYIGPQGIVHGTTLTILNAARKYLGTNDLAGRVFVSSGMGGMSGAQAKAAVICGSIGVVAEVNWAALNKRYTQGWCLEVITDLDALVARIREARAAKVGTSIGFYGNIVSVWKRLSECEDLLVDLGSDQTSCHNPFNGGYYPYQLSFEEANAMMSADPAHFKELVQESLRVQVHYINLLCARGMRFWDYGNSFLLEAGRAGAEVYAAGTTAASAFKRFRHPSYVEDIMGDIFSLGFGPFRWVCTSGNPADLAVTDEIAATVTARLRDNVVGTGPAGEARMHYSDNYLWIVQAAEHKLVVGSQARILYSDVQGRVEIALAFNRAVRDGRITAPVVISRDHHDVSGTDSPFRETANIKDGSKYCADMAIQNVIGDSFRGATWVAIHNGGGTGWGEAINGGFGMLLDGSLDADRRAGMMLHWDVLNGVTRRAWDGNLNAQYTIKQAMLRDRTLRVTEANISPEEIAAEVAASAAARAGAGAAAGAAAGSA